MNLTALAVQLITGAPAGYAVGNLSKEINLGAIGNAMRVLTLSSVPVLICR